MTQRLILNNCKVIPGRESQIHVCWTEEKKILAEERPLTLRLEVSLAYCGSVSEANTKGISREYRRRIGKESDCWKLKIDAHDIKYKKERKKK